MSAEIPIEARPLLDEPNFAHLATLMPDGMPQTTPIWVERDGDTVLFNTALGRAKARNIAADPRVALSVSDRENPYSYLQVRGRAEIIQDGAIEQINRLSHKYMGIDYPYLQEGEHRVVVRVTPDAVTYQAPQPQQ